MAADTDQSTAHTRATTPPSRDRGQATQVGLMLAVAVIVSLFAVIQVQVAPAVQARTEYNHAAAVLSDMESVYADTLAAADTATTRSTSVRLGSDYPNYVILMQPPGPYGTLKSTDNLAVELANIEAVRAETSDFLDGSMLSFTTSGVTYDPTYHEYASPPHPTIRRTVVYNDYQNTNEVIASSNVVNGRELSLIVSTADFSKTAASSVLLYSEALSATTTTVRVQGSGGNPIRIRLQSRLSVDTWRQMLGDELDGDTSAASPSTDNDGKFIAEIQKDTGTSPPTIVIVLETGATYNLQMAKVGYRPATQPSFPASETPDARYLTTRQSTTQIAAEEETIPLTVQVRDRFNNAKSGTVVQGTVLNGGSLDAIQKISTSDGTVTFFYTAPEITQSTSSVSEQTHRVEFELLTGSGAEIRVVFEIRVQNTHN